MTRLFDGCIQGVDILKRSTYMAAKELSYLGKPVMVEIDRPMYSKHPTFGFEYPLNYGFLPNTIGGDGQEIDAYIIGLPRPAKKCQGVVHAVIIRRDDIENKLVVTPKDLSLIHI